MIEPGDAFLSLMQTLEAEIERRRRAENEVRRLSTELESLGMRTRQFDSAREEERAHMAREIHDVLGQALTIIKINVSIAERRMWQDREMAAEKLVQVTAHVDQTIRDLRRVANELRPPLLDSVGLAAAIQSYGEDFMQKTGIQVYFREGMELPPLSSDQNISVFRIAQESLTNVVRHSAATLVLVSLSSEAHLLELTVRDNGQGFVDPGTAGKASLGLLGMQERAKLANGELSITSTPGAGTNVTLRIPLAQTSAAG